jgi:hypothetical protein
MASGVRSSSRARCCSPRCCSFDLVSCAKRSGAGFDLDKAEWRYLVTKTKTEHLVPLAPQAVAILRELHPLTGSGRYVFPGT